MTRRLDLVAGLALGVAVVAGHAAAAEPTVSYVVRRGDTLYDLARSYLLRIDDYRILQRRNHVANPRRLAVGSKLSVPLALLRTEPVEARLGAYKGAVTISTAGKPLLLAQGAVLSENSLISTGPNSFARLDLPDGSRVTLPSQSRVGVVRLRRTLMTGAVDREFLVEAGRSESTVTPLRNPRDRYIVRTPMSVSAVRGTEFRVWYAPDEARASTEVVHGTVAVNATGDHRTTLVPAEFGVTATKDALSSPISLPAAPRLLDPGKTQDDPRIAFDLTPADQARAYRAQLALDAGFLDVFAETTSDAPHVAFDDVGDGSYFVRATVVDANGLEGVPATYAFERALNTLDLKALATSRAGRTRRYLFRWDAGGEGTRTFRFELRRQGDGPPVIDESGLAERQITVTDLRPGDYTWRVMSRTFNRGRHVDKWSPTQTFQIGR
jgi:hypothetical protein